MERKEFLTPENKIGVKVANSHFNQQPTKIKGTLTSQIQLRGENKDPYYYAFVKLKKQNTDLPVIFKVKDENGNLTEPNLKKGDLAELTGTYAASDKNVRKSFTCSFYQLISHDE